jgi:hypothetical protein
MHKQVLAGTAAALQEAFRRRGWRPRAAAVTALWGVLSRGRGGATAAVDL